jgi:peptide/nickel transport system ATP-binding protein
LHAISKPILTIEDLRVETMRGTPIIDDISLNIRKGEVLALVGESGCGKTTLAMAILGNARLGSRITGGSIWFDGNDILRLPTKVLRQIRGARISYVPQDPTAGLNPRHRIINQLSEGLIVHGATRATASDIAFDLLCRVGLPSDADFARRYPFELSGGQQQRVAIAMALSCRPAIVVMDEPTTGLDVTTQARVLELIRELNRELGAAFVYVTHDLAVVDGLADRVCIMYAGRIVERGSRPLVFEAPAHPYTSMLLASVPTIGQRHHLVGIPGMAPSPGSRPPGCFFGPRCPKASQICRREFPQEIQLREDRSVRCWFATVTAPSPSAGPVAIRRTTPSQTLLRTDRISAAYGRGSRRQRVLHDVSLSIDIGECLALVGESGSGKTTLGRCIAGLHIPDSGALFLYDFPLEFRVSQRTQRDRRAIQLVYQNPDRSLNPRETVRAAIARPLRLYSLSDSVSEHQEIARLLERVRLTGRSIDRYPGELSGGEKQRVAIARALAARPELLVCDEVTSSLDVSVQAAIVSLLDELRRDGLALLFITHNLALVSSIADRVLVLERGQAQEVGEARSVLSRPEHAYTRQLVAAVPRLTGAQVREELP